MKAEIIAVGTEILTGQIVNTNAQFLSEKLASLGIDVYYHVAVGDNEGRLFSTIETASKRSDLVILCGGLGGPTTQRPGTQSYFFTSFTKRLRLYQRTSRSSCGGFDSGIF